MSCGQRFKKRQQVRFKGRRRIEPQKSRNDFKGGYFLLTIITIHHLHLRLQIHKCRFFYPNNFCFYQLHRSSLQWKWYVNCKSVSKSKSFHQKLVQKLVLHPLFLGECDSIYHLCQGVTRPGGGGGHWKEEGGGKGHCHGGGKSWRWCAPSTSKVQAARGMSKYTRRN